MQTKNILKWTKALRSGKYKQTQGALHNKKGYCCLGVACELFIPKHKRITTKSYSKLYITGSQPYDQPSCPEWLKNINYDFPIKLKDASPFTSNNSKYDNDRIFSLVDLNDFQEFTFDEIADILELVYIHKILD